VVVAVDPDTDSSRFRCTTQADRSRSRAGPSCPGEVRDMFEEMVGWAVEGGADLIIGETFYYAGEALAALKATS